MPFQKLLLFASSTPFAIAHQKLTWAPYNTKMAIHNAANSNVTCKTASIHRPHTFKTLKSINLRLFLSLSFRPLVGYSVRDKERSIQTDKQSHLDRIVAPCAAKLKSTVMRMDYLNWNKRKTRKNVPNCTSSYSTVHVHWRNGSSFDPYSDFKWNSFRLKICWKINYLFLIAELYDVQCTCLCVCIFGLNIFLNANVLLQLWPNIWYLYREAYVHYIIIIIM